WGFLWSTQQTDRTSPQARRYAASPAALAWAGNAAKASDYGPARRAGTGADAAEKSGSVPARHNGRRPYLLFHRGGRRNGKIDSHQHDLGPTVDSGYGAKVPAPF